jgi:methylthioribose-1-phosphate isomerase
MKVDGTHYRSLWWDTQAGALQIIDQRWLPHDFRIATLDSLDDYALRSATCGCAARR